MKHICAVLLALLVLTGCAKGRTAVQEKRAAIADIRQQVAQLSVEIAEKVLRQNLKDDKAQMDLIDRMLDEVSTDK